MHISTLTAALAMVLAAQTAQAQTTRQSFTLNNLRYGEMTRDGFSVARPISPQAMKFDVGVMVDHAWNPLVYEATLANNTVQSYPIVQKAWEGRLGINLGLTDSVALMIGQPFTLQSTGKAAALGSVNLPAVNDSSAGDTELGLRWNFLKGDNASIGIQGNASYPALRKADSLSSKSLLAGERGLAGRASLLAEFNLGGVKLGANVGGLFRKKALFDAGQPALNDALGLQIGNMLTGSLGLIVPISDVIDFHAEGFGATSLEKSLTAIDQKGASYKFGGMFNYDVSPAEVLGGFKLHPTNGLVASVAYAHGLTKGAGAPSNRVVFGLGFSPSLAPAIATALAVPAIAPIDLSKDSDNDGVADGADKCPNEAEDKDGFKDDDGCPEADNDEDGLADAADKCPNEAEDKDGFMDDDGCPDLDNDNDGILDAADKCPAEAEDKDGFMDDDGCPEADNDKDGVLDADDKCPTAPGTAKDKGCPKSVRMENGKIIILQQVKFATGKDKILPASFAMLKEVKATLDANPQIKTVRVEGHTDNVGKPEKNLDLSKRRALSVMNWLVSNGEPAERITSDGFGDARPIESNKTAKGRAANRRVDFVIVGDAPAAVPAVIETPAAVPAVVVPAVVVPVPEIKP